MDMGGDGLVGHRGNVKEVGEGHPEGADVVEDAAQGPHVRLVVVGVPPQHLHRHVQRGAAVGGGQVTRPLQVLRKTEISDFDVPIFGQENICRLQISMDDFVPLKIFQRRAQLLEPDLDSFLRKWFATLRFDGSIQITIFTKFHHNEEVVVLIEVIKMLDNIFMSTPP